MPVRDVNEAVVLTIRFPTITAGQSALSLTSRVTQRDAEIVAWTF